MPLYHLKEFQCFMLSSHIKTPSIKIKEFSQKHAIFINYGLSVIQVIYNMHFAIQHIYLYSKKPKR